MTKINNIKSLFNSHGKVVENYFFMTSMQVISSAFSILIYPYLIRMLGIESYGLYVFAVAVVSYFTEFVSFGFHYPSLKIISQNKDNQTIISKTFSAVFTAKFILFAIATALFILLLNIVPYMQSNKLLFIVVYSQLISEIFYPSWYFQAVQKMKIVTYFQLFFRVASLPFIFIFIKTPDDIIQYSIIATLSIILSTICLFIYIIFKEKIRIRFLAFNQLKSYFADALPFFWSDAVSVLKQQSVTVIIGSFFSMHDVALYDLANKIISIPRMLTQTINMAIFPSTINNLKSKIIKRIVRYETIIGMVIVLFISIFGYWIIIFLGGKSMIASFPILIILSFTIIGWLVVDSYMNFVFIPQKKYYYVTQNKLVALISFVIIGLPATILTNSIYALIVALTLSSFCEVIFCRYLIIRYKLIEIYDKN